MLMAAAVLLVNVTKVVVVRTRPVAKLTAAVFSSPSLTWWPWSGGTSG